MVLAISASELSLLRMLGWSINLFRIRGIQLALHGSFLLLLAYIVAEVLEKALGWVPTRGVVANFLTLLIFAALTLPAAILAWWDAGDEG